MTTSVPLAPDACARTDSAPSTLFTAGFLVRIYHSLARGRASQERAAASGASSRDSLASYDRATRSWRTCQPSLAGDLTAYSATWPKSGMTRSGRAYALPMLGRRTSASACSSWPGWPTPTVMDGAVGQVIGSEDRFYLTRGGAPRNLARSGVDGSVGLARFMALWPTLRANDGKKGDQCDPTNPRNGLAGATRLWHTPQAADGEGSRRNGPGISATGATPDGRKVSTSLASDLRDHIGRLNPAWVEVLMGFPLGWTDVGPPVPATRNTSGSRRARRSASSQPARTD